MRPSALVPALLLVFGPLALPAQQPVVASPAEITGRIEIAEPAYGAYVGSTLDMAAAVWATGASVTSTRAGLRWHSSDLHTAWITDEGTLTLFKPGTVTITASHGKISASTTIEVLPNPAKQLEISGDAPTRSPADTTRLLGLRARAARTAEAR